MWSIDNCNTSHLNELEVMQNQQALRFLTETAKSTPLAYMQVLTINNPLKQKTNMTLILHNNWQFLLDTVSQYKYHDRNLKTPKVLYHYAKNMFAGTARKNFTTSLSCSLF
jgi:hypothetical protein